MFINWSEGSLDYAPPHSWNCFFQTILYRFILQLNFLGLQVTFVAFHSAVISSPVQVPARIYRAKLRKKVFMYMQHIPVKREARQGSTRVDLGWNGTEAKMERVAKEEMAEEVVMVFLDSFFKHQWLTWRLLHSGDCGGFFPLGPHPNSHLGNFGLIWPFPPLAVCQSKLICGENSHVFPFFPFSLFWLEVHIWNQEWVHRPWRGGSSSGSWLAQLWRGGYGNFVILWKPHSLNYKTDSLSLHVTSH